MSIPVGSVAINKYGGVHQKTDRRGEWEVMTPNGVSFTEETLMGDLEGQVVLFNSRILDLKVGSVIASEEHPAVVASKVSEEHWMVVGIESRYTLEEIEEYFEGKYKVIWEVR